MKKILWTGGWDSTYRFLDLIINKKEIVQPYYVIDQGRASTEMEIKTMNKIKNMVIDINQDFSKQILETITIDRRDIPKNEYITYAYNELKKQSHLGEQYDWLARYMHSLGVSDLELCIHKDDTVEGFIKNDVKLITEKNDKFYKLVDKPSQNELDIFSYYHFPLFKMTKIDMEKYARESGFDHIMEVTWFCHRPFRGRACGMCNPCKYTREEGLGRRVTKPTILMKLKRYMQNRIQGLKNKLINI